MCHSTNYFFSRCIELLHEKTFDTYRVNLHNPITILYELEKCIKKYDDNRIKHFSPTITSIVEEAKSILSNNHIDEVLKFNTFPKKSILKNFDIKDDKKNRSLILMCKTICNENKEFSNTLCAKILDLITIDKPEDYSMLDDYTSWLIIQLQYEGFSRKYINNYIQTAKKLIDNGGQISDVLTKLTEFFMRSPEHYEVIFKYKKNTPGPLRLASSNIDEIDQFPENFIKIKWVNDRFKEKQIDENYLKVTVIVHDFWSALKKAKSIVTETIELNSLHDSEMKINIDSQALSINVNLQKIRMEQTHETLDGFYDYEEPAFVRFIDNYKRLEEKTVAREKLHSAIRFYMLGNESPDIEHKVLNYWIGLEQLFAAIDKDEDSIARIKTYYKAISGVNYLQRRTTYLIDSLKRAGLTISLENFKENSVVDSTGLPPMLETRLNNYKDWLNKNNLLRSKLESHEKKLNQHLTRIYRVRNELVHEGHTTIDLFLIAGHLRHYLIFSIEQITNELVENPTLEHLDDVFTYYENKLDCIKNASNIHEIYALKAYSGYME